MANAASRLPTFRRWPDPGVTRVEATTRPLYVETCRALRSGHLYFIRTAGGECVAHGEAPTERRLDAVLARALALLDRIPDGRAA